MAADERPIGLVPVPRTADDKVDVRALCKLFDEAENGPEAQR